GLAVVRLGLGLFLGLGISRIIRFRRGLLRLGLLLGLRLGGLLFGLHVSLGFDLGFDLGFGLLRLSLLLGLRFGRLRFRLRCLLGSGLGLRCLRGFLQQGGDAAGRLRALVDPPLCPLGVELEALFLPVC